MFTKQAVLDVVGTVPRPFGPWVRVTLRIQGTDLVLRSREAPTNRDASSPSGVQGTSKHLQSQVGVADSPVSSFVLSLLVRTHTGGQV